MQDFIVLRSSPDWMQFDVRDSIEFCRRVRLPDDTIINFCRTWDSLFALSYRAFRAATKAISLASFAACRDLKVIRASDISSVNASAHSHFFFTDDDDWFHPNLAAMLRSSTADAAYWGSIRFGARPLSADFVGTGGPFVDCRPFSDTIYTNNYMVSGATLAKYSLQSLMEHFAAQSVLTGHSLKVEQIKKYLSCSVKHPASTMFIVNATKFSKDKDVLRALFVQYCDAMAHCSYDPQTLWIKPYAERINDLCARTLASAK